MTTWLIAGLGNPGPAYATTRHNAGYLVTDALAERVGSPFRAHKSRRADVVEGRLAGEHVVLVRSRGFMNESGGPIAQVGAFYGVEASNLVVIHDELDIDFGALRLKFGGGDNGHNGLKSLRQAFGTGDWYRVRFGIGRPPGSQSVHDFVLKSFSSTENKDLGVYVETAADAVESLISVGLEKSQNLYNR